MSVGYGALYSGVLQMNKFGQVSSVGHQMALRGPCIVGFHVREGSPVQWGPLSGGGCEARGFQYNEVTCPERHEGLKKYVMDNGILTFEEIRKFRENRVLYHANIWYIMLMAIVYTDLTVSNSQWVHIILHRVFEMFVNFFNSQFSRMEG